jgi:hypothetical protein
MGLSVGGSSVAERSTVERDTDAWWRLWSMAALAHTFGLSVGEWSGRAFASLLVGFVALAMLVRPHDRRLRIVLPAAILVLVWFEAPLIGNHWLIAGFVSAVALLARPSSDGWLERAAPGLRAVLLVFYSFAAFAKLNSGFFDATESCARFFANQTLELYRLPLLPAGSLAAWVAIVASAAIELSVPVLLVVRRTRRFGVVLAIAFHVVLALDLRQHFFDFTLVLVPLFLLFARPGMLAEFDRRLGGPRHAGAGRWVVPLAAMVIAFTLPVPSAYKGLAVLASWALWLVLLVTILRTLPCVYRADGRSEAMEPPLAWRVSVPVLAVVALTMLNGLSPYLELKTATAYNMYANLVTGGGGTNHFIVPATAGLRDGAADIVTIVETDDEKLAGYVDSGFALPFANLSHHLARHPESALTYVRDGETHVIERAGDHPELQQRMPILLEKFALVRAVPLDDPPACQNAWLPAR